MVALVGGLRFVEDFDLRPGSGSGQPRLLQPTSDNRMKTRIQSRIQPTK